MKNLGHGISMKNKNNKRARGAKKTVLIKNFHHINIYKYSPESQRLKKVLFIEFVSHEL
jgi:hypothetical protein